MWVAAICGLRVETRVFENESGLTDERTRGWWEETKMKKRKEEKRSGKKDTMTLSMSKQNQSTKHSRFSTSE